MSVVRTIFNRLAVIVTVDATPVALVVVMNVAVRFPEPMDIEAGTGTSRGFEEFNCMIDPELGAKPSSEIVNFVACPPCKIDGAAATASSRVGRTVNTAGN